MRDGDFLALQRRHVDPPGFGFLFCAFKAQVVGVLEAWLGNKLQQRVINECGVVCVGGANDILRIQSIATECKPQFNDAPAQNRIRQKTGLATEQRADQEQKEDIQEEIVSRASNPQVAGKEQEYRHAKYDGKRAYIQQERDCHPEVKWVFQSIVFPDL